MHDEEKLTLLPTRAAFIRGLPESMPIEEVIERGREIGLSINPSDVHSVRYYMRQEAARKAPPQPQSKVAANSPAEIAAAVRRNYALLDSQRSDQDGVKVNGPSNGASNGVSANGTNGTNGTITNGVKKTQAARGTAPSIVLPAGRGKTGSKSRPFLTDGEIARFEEQVKYIATRIGTDRIRDLMNDLERAVRDID